MKLPPSALAAPLVALALALAAAPATAQAPPPVAAPDPATPPEQKARELFAAGKLDDALKELQNAVRLNPKLPPARAMLARLCYEAQQGQLARQALEAAAVEEPRHPDVYLLNASFAFGERRFTDAVLNLQTALALSADPRFDADQKKRLARESRLGLAAAFEARRDFAAAQDVLKVVLTDEPKFGPARVKLGAALFFLGKPEEAFAEFQAANRDDPATDVPELQMAGLYTAQGSAEKAEEWYKKAVAARPAEAKPHRAYAGWLLDQGKVPEAQAYVEAAGKIEPAGRDQQSLKGLYQRYTKDFPGAEATFEAVHKESPANTFAAINLALVLAEGKDKDKTRRAVELAESEVRKNDRAVELVAALGWCYYKAGRLDDAEKALARSAQLGAMSRDGAYFIAQLQADKQRYTDAVRILKQALDARGAFVYRADAVALLADVEKKAPPAEPKK